MIQKICKYSQLLLLSVVLLFVSISPLFAQSSLSIGVAPTSQILQMEPGETYTDEIVFWNLSQEAGTYRVYVSGFRQIENQPGTAIILTPEEDAIALYSASQWFSVNEETVYLEPNKNVKLEYSITVPEDAPKGEFNAEIFLISESDTQQNMTVAFANLAAGTPFLIQIGDEFVENAELLRFVTNKKTYESIDVVFQAKIKNLGDTHITPTGEIIIENIFKQEVARIPFNNNSQSLLRENIGNYEDKWNQSSFLSPDNAIALGPLTAKLLVTYRTFHPGFNVLNGETTFWIIPWKIIIAIFTAILLAIMLMTWKKKTQKSR